MLKYVPNDCMGRVSSVGTAIPYGLDGPLRTQFFVRVLAVPGAHPAVKGVPGLFPGGGLKRPRRGVDRPPRLAPKLKKE